MDNTPKGASGTIDDIPSKSKKRGSICLEREIDVDIKSPEHKKPKEQVTQDGTAERKYMKTLSPLEMALETHIACNIKIVSKLLIDAEDCEIEKYGIKNY